MRVGEGGVRVHNGGVIAEQVNIADVRASANGMWRRGLQILSEESTQDGAVAFGALRWQGHIHLRPAQCAIAVGSDVKRDRSGRAIRGWSKRQLLRSELFIGRSGASSVVLGSLRDSSSAATEPATEPLNSRYAACAASQGRNPCGDKLAAGSSAVNRWTPCPVLAACSAM